MKMKKGFTLIELMIVIAIISIIAAIAIPNLMQSRIRANEATAVTALKNYCTAQVTFQVGRQGRASTNTGVTAAGYCEVYPNLFYGNPVIAGDAADSTTNLALISKAHADASESGFTNVVTTPTDVPSAPIPYQGYEFDNPADATGSDFFRTSFGQVGAPSKSGSTGNNIYWVGVEGTVYFQGVAKGNDAGTSISGASATPSMNDYSGWISL